MLVSMNWIEDFVDLSTEDKTALINRFTLSTAEVEDIIYKGEDTTGVVAAKVLSVEKHPDSKKLHLLKVDRGDKIVDCVCGAPNVYEGMTVAFACEGGQVCGMPIAKTTVAGYLSEGMCVSGAELQISDDNSGILDIKDDIKIGTDIKEIYQIDDIIFEVDNKSLTNRPDLWGHYGIAREFAALTGNELKKPEIDDCKAYEGLPDVDITPLEKNLLYRYTSIKIDNISVAKSPVNMAIRLYYCGMRSKNLLADLTNYVMLEQGQPMHAFDLKKVPSITVRCYDKEFDFETLDGVTRKIDKDTLMICTDEIPVCIAGIMGGKDSEITDDTTGVLLESANFDGISVRKSSTRLSLRTDASMRYEKVLDPEITPVAAGRFVKLLLDIDSGAKVISNLTDCYVRKYDEIKIDFNKKYIDRYTGIDIKTEEIKKTLTALGFSGTFSESGDYSVTVPSWRATKDVTIPADIVEEITRIYGYDNFEITTTLSPLAPVERTQAQKDERKIKDILVNKYALNEVNSYIWCDNAKYKSLGLDVEENVRIVNAMTVGNDVIRNNIVPSLLVFANENKNNSDDFGIFEVGRVVEGFRDNKTCNEVKKLGIVLFSRTESEKELYLKLHHMVSTIVKQTKHKSASFKNTNVKHSWQHPVNTSSVSCDGLEIGEISTLHPLQLKKLDKKANVVCAQIDVEKLAQIKTVTLAYNEPSKFPGMDVDLNFDVSEGQRYSDIEEAILKAAPEHMTDMTYVDFYKADGVKAMTVRLLFSSKDKTLAREEIDQIVKDLLKKLESANLKLKD